ncbi:MAG: hypothetical protein GX478_00320 [Erysipelotrichaceae bacterium]|nr:hypothetical protein [Erysipelotrichaceae bacterium]
MKKKKMRIIQITTVSVFVVLIFAVTITNLAYPKATFSENENRVLSPFPSLSLSNIFGGDFDDQFETWFADHFFARDTWIQAKAAARISAGAIENNSVYLGSNGHLIGSYTSYDTAAIGLNIQSINEFSQEIKQKVNVMIVPGSAYGSSQYLPSGAYNLDEADLISQIYAQMPEQNTLNVCEELHNTDAYFKTDHHWNTAGAYAAYQKICASVTKTVPQSFTYTEVADDFKGTMYSKSGAFWNQGESLYRIDPASDNPATVTMEDGTVMDSLYNDANLSGKDKYTYYIDGNHAYEKIQTSVNNGKKAVIVKDSYAHILVPYLAQEYSEIDLIDLRYYKNAVSSLVSDPGSTDVYVIYSLDEFAGTRSLAALW